MFWQWLVVGLLIAVALAYLARQAWRTLRGRKAGCGTSCGCASKPTTPETNGKGALIPADQITLRFARQQPPGNNS